MAPEGQDLKAELLRLRSEVQRRAAKADPSAIEFFKSAVRRISQIKGTRFAETRYECLNDCAKSFYAAGEYQAGTISTRHMLAIARTSDRPEWARMALNVMGVMALESGNFPDALVHFHESIRVAHDLDDAAGQAGGLCNVGIALSYATLYQEAIPYFISAIEHSQAGGDHRWIASFYTNLAQSYLATAQLNRAAAAIRRAIELSFDDGTSFTARERAIREWTFVEIALERGELREAQAHVEAAEQLALRSESHAVRFQAELARGLYEVHRGDVDKALLLLHRTLEESQRYTEGQRVDALVTLVKAYEVCERPEPALYYLRQLMQVLSRRRQMQLESLVSGEPSAVRGADAEGVDLHAWKYREARLTAAVAQREVINARQDMLERLAITASLKEDASGEHGYRVGRLASLLAEDLGWPKDQCYMLDVAGRLHDIGKVGIPDRILLGSQELKDAERHFMRAHTTMGAELLAKSDVPQMKIAEEVARCHHECWDGSGYPANLSGERIPLCARIVALADVFDALTHGRPYAAAWSADDALAQIRRTAGTQFDPALIERFINLVGHVRQKHPDLDEYLGRAAHESAFLSARRKLQSMLASEQQALGQHAL
jgi:HD-GYP domain-containing protein (c-di-GMP phosphodiesterase class II)